MGTLRFLSLASLLFGGAVATGAQVLDFDAAAYAPGKTLVGVDGWARLHKSDSAVPASHLIIQEEAGEKLARCNTAFAGSVYREFPGAQNHLELRWRWRSASAFVHMCFGVSRASSIDGFYPLALACIEPSGVMEAKGSQAVILAEKWATDRWIYMRMLVDAARNTYSLRMAYDSTLADEKQIHASAPLNDLAQSLSRVVIRMQNGTGQVDLDRIVWQPVASLAGIPPALLAAPRDTAVVAGAKAAFRVVLNSNEGSTFQWTRDGLMISGATAPDYEIASTVRADSGALFACRVSGAWGNFTTAAARLRVLPATVKPDTTAPKPDTTLVKPDTAVIKPDTSKPVNALVLEGGKPLSLAGGYSLATAANTDPVQIDLLGPETFSGLRGFRDLKTPFRVSPRTGGSPFPQVEFAFPAGETRSLYGLEDGLVRFESSGGNIRLVKAGTYFLGIDTMPPRIVFLGESFEAGDSTRSRFLVEDNIRNPTLDLARSDDGRLGFLGRTVASGETLSVALKAAGTGVEALSLKLKASDHRGPGAFPSEYGLSRFLSQRLSGPRRTPDRFSLGRAASPWDLVTLPASPESPLTLDALRKQNPDAGLHAAVWEEERSGYRRLSGDDVLAAGASIWLASTKGNHASLLLPSLQTLPLPEWGHWKVTLRRGWNQVANPTLATLYWPSAASAGSAAGGDLAPVKSPRAYDPESGTYALRDSLEPWRGYFVLNNGGDTTVTLLPAPPARPLSKTLAKHAGYGPLAIRLKLAGATVRLGANPQAVDGFGVEDEPSPPSPVDGGARLAARRNARTLETDIIQWRNDALLAWRVVLRGPAEGKAAVEALTLPEGYAVWAVSRSRGLRMRLDAESAIPTFADYTDTLDVYAGPVSLLEANLAAIPASVDHFGAEALASTVGPGFDLSLRLPGASRLSWTLVAPDGRVLDGANLTLPAGHYRLEGGRRVRARGTAYLRVAWSTLPGATADPGSSAHGSGHWSRRLDLN